ncbi:MAG: hypothetical protein LBG58_14445 [Planctomycetaceae bacterium]|jgi:hypothetical protein|nr:hypothetical protein [Planctomycetaceae bacterium]
MDTQFLDEQFAEFGLSRETVKDMSLREIVQCAKEIHREEPKVVGTSHSPVSGNYYLMTDRIGQLNVEEKQ